MSQIIQLDFFKTEEEVEKDTLKQEVQNLRHSLDKQRKALFARHGELAKMYLNLLDRMEIIERNICRNSTNSVETSRV